MEEYNDEADQLIAKECEKCMLDVLRKYNVSVSAAVALSFLVRVYLGSNIPQSDFLDYVKKSWDHYEAQINV